VKLLSEREQVRSLVKRWRERDPGYRLWDARGDVDARLDALDPETATAADVRAAGVNWARLRECDECREESWDCVELGEEPDHGSRTATICERCLRKALALIERERFVAGVKKLRAEFAEAVGRHMGAKAFSADIARGIDWNEVVLDWFAASDGSAGAAVTGTDLATGRDWTAVTDEGVRDGEVAPVVAPASDSERGDG
jgi:hypothetical protein